MNKHAPPLYVWKLLKYDRTLVTLHTSIKRTSETFKIRLDCTLFTFIGFIRVWKLAYLTWKARKKLIIFGKNQQEKSSFIGMNHLELVKKASWDYKFFFSFLSCGSIFNIEKPKISNRILLSIINDSNKIMTLLNVNWI